MYKQKKLVIFGCLIENSFCFHNLWKVISQSKLQECLWCGGGKSLFIFNNFFSPMMQSLTKDQFI